MKIGNGNPMLNLPIPNIHLLCGDHEVHAIAMEIAVSFLLNGKRVFWVDGGNTFNPYTLSIAAKRLGIDPYPLLRRLFVARPFTAHQLGSMIVRRLEPALGKYPDALGVIFDPLSLCNDEDVPERDAIRVLHQIAAVVRRLRETGCRVIIAIPDNANIRQGRNKLLDILRTNPDNAFGKPQRTQKCVLCG